MLNIRHGDQTGLSRRDFLRVGALGLVGGLTQTEVFRLQARAQAKSAHKAVIMIYLPGGPSHIDMYDLKPDAPSEIRGDFKPIRTNVPGMEICELMPLQAKIADKFAIVRGLKTSNEHAASELLSGLDSRLRGNVPSFGCCVSRLRPTRSMPSYVSFADLPRDDDPGYLGPTYRPFTVRRTRSGDVSGAELDNLSLRGMTFDRLAERVALLSSFDQLRRDIDMRREMVGIDAFQAQAFELISSAKVRDAFDLSREAEPVRSKYGPFKDFLLARRLVEAGVSVVTLASGVPARTRFAIDWDTHENHFPHLRSHLPVFDAGVYALITDLCERGLAGDVAVVMWGEFGRTPRLGSQVVESRRLDGRDHWGDAGFVFLAGGGLQTGQVIKDSGPRGEHCTGTPYKPQNVLATLYAVLGIDPQKTTLPAPDGRPRYLLEDTGKIAEL
jgi:hypothetical protein